MSEERFKAIEARLSALESYHAREGANIEHKEQGTEVALGRGMTGPDPKPRDHFKHEWIGDSLVASHCQRCGRDARDGVSAPCVPNKSEGAATREGAEAKFYGPADRSRDSQTPSDPPTKWTEEQREAACCVVEAFLKGPIGGYVEDACAEIARVARIFVDPRGENTGDVTVGLSPERETRPTSTRQQSPRAPAPSGEAAARECSVASPVSPPAPQSPRWTEEQRQAATSIAATVAFWKERADDREIALTCAEIAKHAHLFHKRTISAEEFGKFECAYFDHHGDTLESLRAAFADIGIAVAQKGEGAE